MSFEVSIGTSYLFFQIPAIAAVAVVFLTQLSGLSLCWLLGVQRDNDVRD